MTHRDIERFYHCRSAVLSLIEDLTYGDQVMVKQMQDTSPPIPQMYFRKSKTDRATKLQETGEIKDVPFFDAVDILCGQGMDETEAMERVITELALNHQMVEWYRCVRYQGHPYWNVLEVDPGPILPLGFAWKKIIVPALGFILDFFASYGLGEDFFEVYYTGNKSIHTDSPLSIEHPSEVICSVAQEQAHRSRHHYRLYQEFRENIWLNVRVFNLILGLVFKHESDPELGKHIALTIDRVFRANKAFFDWTASRRLGKDKSKCTPVIMTGLCSRYLFFDEIFQNNALRSDIFDFWKFRRSCYVRAIIRSLYERSVLPQPSRHMTMQLMDKILNDKRQYAQILFEKVYNTQNLPPYEMITSWHLENVLETHSSQMDMLDSKDFEIDKA